MQQDAVISGLAENVNKYAWEAISRCLMPFVHDCWLHNVLQGLHNVLQSVWRSEKRTSIWPNRERGGRGGL